MADAVRIGLLGCGVVGTGVVEVLAKKGGRFPERLGRSVRIQRIVVRDVTRPRSPLVDRRMLNSDWREVCLADDVDVVIEVMGGTDAAKDAVLAAIRTGKHVVTANKELMAQHGHEIRSAAAGHGVTVRYEASVLGGIPALHTLETYFQLNHIQKLRGIVNGTCNYILTQMHQSSAEFEEALAQAQELGYAESNPSMDIDGFDAWYKLQILLDCLGVPADLREHAPLLGIRGIERRHVDEAQRRGGKLKLVVEARWDERTGTVLCSVGPVTVLPDDPLYGVDGVQNAICLEGDVVGEITLMGPGAGAEPTASAVLEDLMKIVRATQAVPV